MPNIALSGRRADKRGRPCVRFLAVTPFLLAVFAGVPGTVMAQASEVPRYRLDELIALAREAHPALAAVQARVDTARAAVRTAATFSNPELEVLGGRQRARMPGAVVGSTTSVSVTQPVDWPALRERRTGAAAASLDRAQAESAEFFLDLVAELRRRYHQVQHAQVLLHSASEDLGLAGQIRDRVAVRVSTGEAPRFELVRADTELLNAQRVLRTAELRVQQAQQELRRLVGPGLPAVFELAKESAADAAGAELMPLDALRRALLEQHPGLLAARAELRAAEARLGVERVQRLPRLALRAGLDREPEVQGQRIGVVLSVPLLDRRVGPIAEAEAELRRSSHLLSDRELQLTQQLDVAWQQVRIAAGQVAALEGGILRQAQDALRIAEVAYRSGERGILEWLDAQRAFRQARNDLITARHELRLARVELDRLQGLQP